LPYQTTHTTAFELLRLATEWGVPQLEEAVTDFINSKSLQQPSEGDVLAKLIRHTGSGQVHPNGILAVANIINDPLQGERVATLPPEILFQIVVSVDPAVLDPDVLINYVTALFDAHPQSAVPLVLLLDFDKLTQDQRDFVFRCSQMYEQNVGFFVTHLMSNDRTKAERELAQADGHLLCDLFGRKNGIDAHEATVLSKLKNSQDEALGAIRQKLNDQQAEIETLKEQAGKHGRSVTAAAKSHSEQFSDMKVQLEKLASEESSEAEGQTSTISS
jgi:hypothetical protein